MSYDFAGKVILVTSGAGGTGRALWHRFAAAGAALVIAGLDEARARRRAVELPGSGHLGLGCDLLDHTALDQLPARAAGTHRRLDVVVHKRRRDQSRAVRHAQRREHPGDLDLNLLSPLRRRETHSPWEQVEQP